VQRRETQRPRRSSRAGARAVAGGGRPWVTLNVVVGKLGAGDLSGGTWASRKAPVAGVGGGSWIAGKGTAG